MVDRRLHSHPAVALALRARVPPLEGDSAEKVVDLHELVVGAGPEPVASTPSVKIVVGRVHEWVRVPEGAGQVLDLDLSLRLVGKTVRISLAC